jgi:hypothetical protein
MALFIRDPEVDALAEEVGRSTRVGFNRPSQGCLKH